MPWLALFIAGLFEVVWAIALKYSNGFRLWIPTVISVIGMIASVVGLELAMRKIPVGTACAVWTGIGATGTAILGMMLFGESANAARLGCIALIVLGILGLKFLA
jgi:quaternary ammonium compound-resistance protein SugE